MIELRNPKNFTRPGGQDFRPRRINMDVREGEFVSSWASGSGKTTLLSVRGLLDSAWAGEYYLLEQTRHRLNQRSAPRWHSVRRLRLQSYHLIDSLPSGEHRPAPYRYVKRGESAALAADILDRFQIVGKKDLYPNQLSGGQQQLVAIARAVIHSPRLILADEPTGNLHSSQGKEIMELFKRLNDQGTTIIQVTHSEQNAAFGNRVVQLADGWMVN